jgi:hypothetical protein
MNRKKTGLVYSQRLIVKLPFDPTHMESEQAAEVRSALMTLGYNEGEIIIYLKEERTDAKA